MRSLLAIIAVLNTTLLAQEISRPLPPADAVKSFRLADGDLIIELIAAEPDVSSPVAIAWDEDGRLYVAEMIDYPLGPASGRIRLLEDPDGKGRYRKATVFADKLPFPNSVLPCKGGVLVTAAPDIWFLKDSQHAGRADARQVILHGFAEGNQQLRVNGLHWGLDNWIYGANGRSGGRVGKPGDPAEKTIVIDRHDFRFKPETGQVETVSGFSQFGLARDDWGNRLPSWNTSPFRHVVLEERYLARNPFLAAATSVAEIADPADPARVHPISPPPTTFNREPILFFNASCGNAVYRGDRLPAKYRGNLFVCEPLTNLVQRRVLEPYGVTFIARRGDKDKEFLASTDPWFHPVNVATGPDGLLYIVDFYRRWVEHPQFVPEALRKQHDWREGSKHGRIWRIRPKNWKPGVQPPLSRATTADLVAGLDHANGWRRDTAQRLLVERQDRRAVFLLDGLVRKARSSQGRVHALWTLQGLNALTDEALAQSLKDAHPAVRQHALQLSEGRWLRSPLLREAILAQAKDAELPVLFQAALVLAEAKDADARQALARIALAGASDDWVRLGVLSGIADSALPFLEAVIAADPKCLSLPDRHGAELLAQIGGIIGTRGKNVEINACLNFLPGKLPQTAMHGQVALVSGLAEGMARSGRRLSDLAHEKLGPLLQFAAATASADEETFDRRQRAIRLLAQARFDGTGKIMLQLLEPRQPLILQAAACRGLADLADPPLVRQALKRWDQLSIPTRRELLANLLRSPPLIAVLLDAVEEETLGATELDPAMREALARLPDPAIRSRASKLFKQLSAGNREEAMRKYQAALTQKGDPIRGADVFTKHCQACHQLHGKGHKVGADLAGVIGRRKEILLVDILDPSKEVAPDFINFMVVTRRGQVLTGMIAAETPASVKLRRAEGVEEIILRSEIQELRSTGKSLMPDGFEQQLSIPDMADLLEFLQRPAHKP